MDDWRGFAEPKDQCRHSWKELTDGQKQISCMGVIRLRFPTANNTLGITHDLERVHFQNRGEMGITKNYSVMETILNATGIKTSSGSSVQWTAVFATVNDWMKSIVCAGQWPNIAWYASLSIDELQIHLNDYPFQTMNFRSLFQSSPDQQKNRPVEKTGLVIFPWSIKNHFSVGKLSDKACSGSMHSLQTFLHFDEPRSTSSPDTQRMISVLGRTSHQEIRDSFGTWRRIHPSCRLADPISAGCGIHGWGSAISTLSINTLSEQKSEEAGLFPFLRLWKDIIPAQRREGAKKNQNHRANHHNLKNIDVAFYTEALMLVTGVSGAGKSSCDRHSWEIFLKNHLNGTMKGRRT